MFCFSRILLFQSFLASTFDFKFNFIMKYVIFQISSLSFLLEFKFSLCNLIFKVFFCLESRELRDPFFA